MTTPWRLCAAAACAAIPLAGCTTPPLDPTPEQTITDATAIGEMVVFRVDAAPLDEPSAGERLTRADAVKRAVLTDPALQAALARVRVALADADQARLLPNPVLQFVLKWSPDLVKVEAALSEDIVQILQTPRRTSAADNRLRQAAAACLAEAIDIVQEVEERYAAAQAGDRLVPLLEARSEIVARLVSGARSRLEAGEGTRGDLITLDGQRVQLEVELADARLQAREDRLRLARLIGEPSGDADWLLDPWTAPATATDSERAWIDAALAHRPEIQAISWELAALGDDYALAKLAPWEGGELGAVAEHDGVWFVGPELRTPIPIFDWGQAKQSKVVAQQMEARQLLLLQKRKVVEEIRVALESLRSSRANLARLRNELLPLEEERHRQAVTSFNAGQSDSTALFLSEEGLREAESKAVEVEKKVTVALVRLQRAAGGPGVSPTATTARVSP